MIRRTFALPPPLVQNIKSVNTRIPLRIEVAGYTGDTLSLVGLTATNGTIIKALKHSDYELHILTRNGLVDPEPSYSYDNTVMDITFAETDDFTAPAGDNLIILLR